MTYRWLNRHGGARSTIYVFADTSKKEWMAGSRPSPGHTALTMTIAQQMSHRSVAGYENTDTDKHDDIGTK